MLSQAPRMGSAGTSGNPDYAVDCAGNLIITGTNFAFGGPDGKTLNVVSNPPNVKFAGTA
jgi:hypothetical protein